MTRSITIQVTGRAEAPTLPPTLVGIGRSADAADDPFLPSGYLRPTATFDVSASARSAAGAGANHAHAAQDDEIVVLELTDGGTLITSAGRLQDALQRSHPEWLADDGTIPLERLREEAAAPGRGLGEALGGLVKKVYTLVAGEVQGPIIEAALDWLSDHGLKRVELGVTWAGTKALMWAVEERLVKDPGLYRWSGSTANDLTVPDARDLEEAAAKKRPLLVFVHGTASSSLGSFGDLHGGSRDTWAALAQHFKGEIFAFEHRTLSEGPIENALQLARALPRGACVRLVTHSRGGLIADLLCVKDFDQLIADFARPANLPGIGDADPDSEAAQAVIAQLDEAYAEHRMQLQELSRLLREKQFDIQRYVRIASPANGTKLASGNFDLFLSGLLTLLGQVPFFFGSPFYAAFKRVVIEIAKNRTDPHMVPGIEAMLPDSPTARFLADAPVNDGIAMAVIAGDIEGGNLFKRLGVLLTDLLFFERDDNDLVVNTSAMLAGIAPRTSSRVLFDRGADVSHFRYFSNVGTRTAMRDWLTVDDPLTLESFRALPDAAGFEAALAASTRDVLETDRPVVVVLPGIMGSHLQVGKKDRVWFDPADIATGGLSKIAWDRPGVEAEDLFANAYGELCKTLATSHRVERFPYDWRQPLDVLAERLGEYLDRLMQQTQQPIRLLAHSMGGLVVRACIHKRRSVMDALMARDGARFVMLGTPNQGAHSMVENLIGKGDTLRMLVRLDVKHSMQDVLDLVAGFRGALQLLPKPGFKDVFQGDPEGGEVHDYQSAQTWVDFAGKVKDFWFGNGIVGRPPQQVLDAAAWLWRQDGRVQPALPKEYAAKSIYVFGVARNTACGVRTDKDGRLKMVGTTSGDGTVSWASGRIGGVERHFYMQASHGDLASTSEHFPALVDLLAAGTTTRLSTSPPAMRAIESAQPVSYDAGPPSVGDPRMLGHMLLGGTARGQVEARSLRRVDVRVHAADLRFVAHPILVGQYEQDPIAGPQLLIDSELLEGELTQRHQLGLYAGPLGSATVVLRPPNEAERRRGSLRGAVVTGLGRYEGSLSLSQLTEAVCTGALRYLLQVVDVLGKDDREVPLAALLLGYNSSVNLTVDASVEALLHGVMEANARFSEATGLNIHIARLDIVEIYLDTALTAVYALRRLQERLAALARRHRIQLVCGAELTRGEGWRRRLSDSRDGSYWPRLLITDASTTGDARRSLGASSPDGAPVSILADRLRFLYVGQRARAESELQQRQPGLIEQLVRQQVADAHWNEDFGRMLFQLMVPHAFKDTARQLARVVLVVDQATANIPWELMLADDPARSEGDRAPLSLRLPMVRQLASDRFRLQVRQNVARTALVIGNPSSAGFAQAFSRAEPKAILADKGAERGTFEPSKEPELTDPRPLPGAQAEAESVALLLGAMGYTVEPVIGADKPAASVLAALYRKPWRILHISAHGIFGLRHRDGMYRSGVVLSDGLLITAAEIEAMEVVPDVVFLNCCHLGMVDVGEGGNRLAASIARELIQIGVRCVVVAGWAVKDDTAQLFGETFYKSLLSLRKPFGEAVYDARKAAWKKSNQDITWGAFQAYGDPTWYAEPRTDGAAAGPPGPFASPDELLDAFSRIRSDLNRLSGRAGHATDQAIDAQIARCPPEWITTPQVQSALGAVWYDLGQFEKARKALLEAIRLDDRDGMVPIYDIAKLANAEARLGEARGEPELIDSAIRRLDSLDELAFAAQDGEAGGRKVNPERSALLGSAYKRKASLAARILIEAQRRPEVLSQAELDQTRTTMVDALKQSVAAYAISAGLPGRAGFDIYRAINRLALDALTEWRDASERKAAAALARWCGERAAERFAHKPDFWDAIMQPEALLVEHLVEGTLGHSTDATAIVFERIVRTYRETLDNVTVTPAQIDSVASQLEVLARLYEALATAGNGRPSTLTAERLRQLASALQPRRAVSRAPATPARPVVLGLPSAPASVPVTAVPAARAAVPRKRSAPSAKSRRSAG